MLAIARRMRKVVEAPESIAVALESEDFVGATETYFAARSSFAVLTAATPAPPTDELVTTALDSAPIVRR
jgi:hypothetical protein